MSAGPEHIAAAPKLTAPTMMQCDRCGGYQTVSADAAVRWDGDARAWDLSAVYDEVYCDNCGEKAQCTEVPAVEDNCGGCGFTDGRHYHGCDHAPEGARVCDFNSPSGVAPR